MVSFRPSSNFILALNPNSCLAFEVFGVDLAPQAIDAANKRFGGGFHCGSLESALSLTMVLSTHLTSHGRGKQIGQMSSHERLSFGIVLRSYGVKS